jgi:hypothetical protein
VLLWLWSCRYLFGRNLACISAALPTILSEVVHGFSHSFNFRFFFCGATAPIGYGLLFIEVSRSHSDTPHSVRLLWTSDRPVAETSTWPHTTIKRDKHPCPLARFEPASPQTHALDRASTGTGFQPLTHSDLYNRHDDLWTA